MDLHMENRGCIKEEEIKIIAFHVITFIVLSVTSLVAINTTIIVIDRFNLLSVYHAYMGISELSLYGCNNAIGIVARDMVSQWFTPYFKCSYVSLQIEMANMNILLYIQWIYRGVLPLIDGIYGFKTYNKIYNMVEKYSL